MTDAEYKEVECLMIKQINEMVNDYMTDKVIVAEHKGVTYRLVLDVFEHTIDSLVMSETDTASLYWASG